MKAVVVDTGANTYLGKSALLVTGEQRVLFYSNLTPFIFIVSHPTICLD
jgi:hypothetical protein